MTDPIARTTRAKQIVEDVLFSEMLAEIEGQYVNEFRKSDPSNPVAREFAYAKLRALDDLRTQFQKVIDNGAVLSKRAR